VANNYFHIHKKDTEDKLRTFRLMIFLAPINKGDTDETYTSSTTYQIACA
jgi:hypothetical protein